jgi:hypothetical protein
MSLRKTKALHERLTKDGYVFIPLSNTVIVSDVTLNNLAGAAGQMLQGLLTSPVTGRMTMQEIFYRKTLRYAAGMIASKIFNPRRKGKDILQYKQLLDSYRGRRLIGLARRRRDVIRSVIRFHEWISMRLVRKDNGHFLLPKAFVRADDLFLEEVSKNLGEMLGYTLYVKTFCQYVPLQAVREVFSQASDLSSAEEFMRLYRTIMH